MMRESLVYTLHLPEYQVDTEPDHELVGKKVDNFIRRHFLGQHVAVRCVSSAEHSDKTTGELIEIIRRAGSDKYDPDRKGDRYENNEGRKIDLFAFDYQVASDTKIFNAFSWQYFHLNYREPRRPIRIDIIIVYDPDKLEQVPFSYPGREHEGMRSDGWIFKEPDNKARALKAIIELTK